MTEKYDIDPCVGKRVRALLEEVLPNTNLPENVTITNDLGVKDAKKPFAVVTTRPSTDGALNAYHAGAIKYEEVNFDKEKFTKDLSLKD